MSKYKLVYAKSYKRKRKKLNQKDLALLDELVEKLATGQKLESKHKDHALKGFYAKFRECHIRPDLLLIYQIRDELLELYLIEVGSHSELF